MFSSQRDSTEDVWVNDKIAHVGVNQRCALTHMQRKKKKNQKQKQKNNPNPSPLLPISLGWKIFTLRLRYIQKSSFHKPK